jgi:hypothetical protein
MHHLLRTFDNWLTSPAIAPVRESILEAIMARRPFSAVTDVVSGSVTVDIVCSLGLVQWQGSHEVPGPIVAPFILLLMLRRNLRPGQPLYHLAIAYDSLVSGSRVGTWWQDFERFLANFRAVRISAFRGRGWVPLAQLHFGARLSTAAAKLYVCVPANLPPVTVARPAHWYPSRSSGGVIVLSKADGTYSVASGAVVVLNGARAPAADIFLDSQATADPQASHSTRLLREAYACRHRVTATVSSAAFNAEWRKAADATDLFLFFSPQTVIGVDLAHPSCQLIGYIDSSCFIDYFGFSGRAFGPSSVASGAASASSADSAVVAAAEVS